MLPASYQRLGLQRPCSSLYCAAWPGPSLSPAPNQLRPILARGILTFHLLSRMSCGKQFCSELGCSKGVPLAAIISCLPIWESVPRIPVEIPLRCPQHTCLERVVRTQCASGLTGYGSNCCMRAERGRESSSRQRESRLVFLCMHDEAGQALHQCVASARENWQSERWQRISENRMVIRVTVISSDLCTTHDELRHSFTLLRKAGVMPVIGQQNGFA